MSRLIQYYFCLRRLRSSTFPGNIMTGKGGVKHFLGIIGSLSTVRQVIKSLLLVASILFVGSTFATNFVA